MPKKGECFIMCPIEEEGTEIRKRADLVFEYIFEPVVKECGYEKAIRADQILESGIITDQILQRIIDAPMAIADLTGLNPNVFYELAVRHLFQKPVVHVIEKGEMIPFDVKIMRTIVIDYTDVKSHKEAKQQLKEQIEDAEKGTKVRNPISITFDLEAYKSSTKPEQRKLGEVLSEISELRAMISRLLGYFDRYFMPTRGRIPTLEEVLGDRGEKPSIRQIAAFRALKKRWEERTEW